MPLYASNLLGYEATATLLASEIPLDSPISSYLDPGTGAGFTAVACSRVVLASSQSFHLLLANGIDEMLQVAERKVRGDINATPPSDTNYPFTGAVSLSTEDMRNKVLHGRNRFREFARGCRTVQ